MGALEEGLTLAQGEKNKNMKKKKILSVGWEESKPIDSEEEQSDTANFKMVDNNICFMANEA